MNEFDIIDTFFKPQIGTRSDVLVGIGDDAAQIATTKGERVLNVDMITLPGNQYYNGPGSAIKLLENSLAVRIEAMQERNITPCWMTLALTLPEQNRAWLQEFSHALRQITATHDIQVIGGDTTHGPFALTVHLLGYAG